MLELELVVAVVVLLLLQQWKNQLGGLNLLNLSWVSSHSKEKEEDELSDSFFPPTQSSKSIQNE